jgi:hypothetical protein
MKLHKNILPDYFTIASPHNSHYKIKTNTFDFVDRNSKKLVITSGDSWSWGADLTPDDNEDYRLEHAYGNIIAKQLNADWLNLSQSGSNNFFIADRIEELEKIISSLDYTKIYLICTFTEIGRSFNSHYDSYIDYISWFKNNIVNESDFDKFLYFLNAECLTRIQKVVKKHNIELRVGSNFVDPIGLDTADGFLKTPWFRLLGIDCPVVAYAGSTGVSRLLDAEQFIPDSKKSLFRSWFVKLIDNAKYIDQVTSTSIHPHVLSGRCGHPQADGHKRWANYILQSIK